MINKIIVEYFYSEHLQQIEAIQKLLGEFGDLSSSVTKIDESNRGNYQFLNALPCFIIKKNGDTLRRLYGTQSIAEYRTSIMESL